MMKNEVREFYDTIGWTQVDDGGEAGPRYQNARYEDLRPVSQEYIHRCHLRVKRHLAPAGRYLLDAGSGPIQYDEYLTYSEGYRYRVCADMSITALKEAREKIGRHGLFVVADIANLPFDQDAFDGVVTLHTIHHLPADEHLAAYRGLHRVLAPGRTAVVVNGWSTSALMDPFRAFSRARKKLWLFLRRLLGKGDPNRKEPGSQPTSQPANQKNTFVEKHDPRWFKRTVAKEMDAEILVWRSASVHFLKNYIFENRGGKRILDWLYRLEERWPRFFGESGTYPLIVLKKD
ncbi:MAG TPA: class I SAM-dependent methyltransferase [Anaerolineales bacterium]|nr:class I SAM-dependent methyltransferase [Anaerolineales bacterium]